MKRKLNEDDVPTAIDVMGNSKSPLPDSSPSARTFSDLGLDPRLLQAIAKANFSSPTPVQAKSIPLALEGKDVLGRSPFNRWSNYG